MNIVKWQRPGLFLRRMETISEIFSKVAQWQTRSESSRFPRFSTSCTTQGKEKRKCINKHVTRRQSCCDDRGHAEKDSFLDLIKM